MTSYQYKNNRTKYKDNLLQLLYLYYRDETNESVNPSFFVSAFQHWTMTYGYEINYAIQTIIEHLDRKYEITLVIDKKSNKVLKII